MQTILTSLIVTPEKKEMRKVIGKIRKKLRNIVLNPSEKRHALVGNPDLWKMKRDFQIQFLKEKGLMESHYLLDLGCGTLRGGIPIIEYLDDGHYFGLEVRPDVLEEARKELADAGLIRKKPILLLPSDTHSLPTRTFNFIWAFSVLIHMDDENLRKAIVLVQSCLAEDGVFYANVNLGIGKELEWQGFPVVRRSLDFYKKVAAEFALTVVDIGDIKSLGHHNGIESQDSQHMLMFSCVQ